MNVLLSAEPSESDLEKLGGVRERWLLYRDMIRKRMRKMIAVGLGRSVAALGEERYHALYDAWLDAGETRTRYIREIVPMFAEFAVPRLNADKDVPRWAVELVQYEAARWLVGYEDVAFPEDVGEFAFEKVPVLNPTLRLLHFEHRIHEPLEEGAPEYPHSPCAVAVYRNRDDDKIYRWVPNALTADLLEGFLEGEEPVTEVVKRVCEARAVPIDAKFIESLGATFAKLITRTMVLGSSPA
jgi:hypothetical protein